MNFVAFGNYVRAFQDPGFLFGLGRTALILLIQVPIMLGFALFFALALDSGRARGSKAVRLLIFLPFAVPGVVAVLMWGYLYGQNFGLTGQITRALGLPPTNFLSDRLILFSIMNIITWAFVGYNMIILYAALKSIPPELYEAAEIDGAEPMATGLEREDSDDSARHPPDRHLLGHRELPDLQRTETAGGDRAHWDHAGVHAQLLRLQPRVREPGLNYAAAIAFLLGFVIMIVSYVVQLSMQKREVRS